MIFVALGANIASAIGEPAQTLRAALARLEASGINIVMRSSFYKTRAWPDPSDPPFTNGVAQLTTALTPAALLAVLHDVEAMFGRTRTRPNAPRTLDLDLLDYDGRIEAGPPILPHPRIAERAFVLRPLYEIAPCWRHPVS
jgi:2-amino-4-hydroxy-6-hydroxymethyldihydropteridine diphosphokinase